jgi:hypothetical protein
MAKQAYYLVDFENVGTAGVEKADKLKQTDHVHLFSTKKASKISTAILAKFNATNLIVHEVAAGSQSLDMHLVSYLGYLIGTQGTTATYVVVSKDTGFDRVIKFWRRESSVSIVRQSALVAEDPNKKAKKKTASKNKLPSGSNAKQLALPQPKQPKQLTQQTEPRSSQQRIVLNASLLKKLSSNGIKGDEIGKAASIAMKSCDKENAKQTIHANLCTEFGQEHGSEIYKIIKPLL